LRCGAFRRLLDILNEESGENERWHHERRQHLRVTSPHGSPRGASTLYEPLPPFQPVITLKHEVIATPPLVIWPEAVVKGEIPADVIEAFGLR